MSIHNYASAAEYLGRKTDRPLEGRSSRLIRRDDSTIAVRYHSTDVVTFKADNTAILNTGGWYSVTTKARMGEYTRARIYSDKGTWYLHTLGASWESPKDKRPLYYDGMIIDDSGTPIAPRYPSLSDVERKRSLDKQVRDYIKGYAADIVANGLQNPSNGDCWGCLFNVADAPEVTQGTFRLTRPTPHGRVEPMGIDHYTSHFEDKYYVPSLLFNAIKARGYRDPAFIWHMIKDRKDGKMAADILRGYFRNLKPQLLAIAA